MDIEEEMVNGDRIIDHVKEKAELMGFYEMKFLYYWKKSE
jgi:hypothetical protein